MRRFTHFALFGWLLLACLGFVACGGSSSDDPQADPLPPPRILFLEAQDDTYRDDIVSKLTAFGFFAAVDVFDANAATPTLLDLQMYDAVLTTKDSGYSDPVALGNVLADYVDAGGRLVVCHFVFESLTGELQGRFTPGYYLITPLDSTSTGDDLGMNVLVPGYPILDGVTTFLSSSAPFRPTGAAVAGATVIAEWDDGANTPLIVVGTVNGVKRCDLGFYPPTTDTGRADFLEASSDSMRILANALLWVCDRI